MTSVKNCKIPKIAKFRRLSPPLSPVKMYWGQLQPLQDGGCPHVPSVPTFLQALYKKREKEREKERGFFLLLISILLRTLGT